ncbi:putative alpha/beta-fold hydrolase [Paraburkholderia atlantica]|uniref:hypothetical protein n=1 Tax=Paraburkholderia atlantica TaxID=2654982 RepID=UPI003D215AD4
MARRLLFVLLVLPVLVVGCENFAPAGETAQHALRVFCSLHRADILSTLLTEQQQAGTVVCHAIGMSLGT